MSKDLTIFRTTESGEVQYREPARERVIVRSPRQLTDAQIENSVFVISKDVIFDVDVPVTIGLSGSWRHVPPIMAHDIRLFVRWIITAGYRLMSGGALGADFIATEEALRLMKLLQLDKPHNRLRIILPTPLTVYAQHFRNRASEGVITTEAAEALIAQLTEVQSFNGLEEMTATECTPETYYARNSRILGRIERLGAFQTNNSQGVQDAIDKARDYGLPVILKRYSERQCKGTGVVEMTE